MVLIHGLLESLREAESSYGMVLTGRSGDESRISVRLGGGFDTDRDRGGSIGNTSSGLSTSTSTGAVSSVSGFPVVRRMHSRRSGMKLTIAVMRRSVVATCGLEMACLMCVSSVRRTVLPVLSTSWVDSGWDKVQFM